MQNFLGKECSIKAKTDNGRTYKLAMAKAIEFVSDDHPALKKNPTGHLEVGHVEVELTKLSKKENLNRAFTKDQNIFVPLAGDRKFSTIQAAWDHCTKTGEILFVWSENIYANQL